MVVLLVYDHQGVPITVVAHGYNGQTHFSLVESPEQDCKNSILQSLVAEGFASISGSGPMHLDRRDDVNAKGE